MTKQYLETRLYSSLISTTFEQLTLVTQTLSTQITCYIEQFINIHYLSSEIAFSPSYN